MKKIFLIVIALAVVIGSNIVTFVTTKDSYRKIGINDGRIELGLEVISALKGLKKIQSCQQINSQKMISLLEVKSASLRVVPLEGEAFSLCIYE